MEKTYELLAGEKSSKLWQRGRDITKDQFDRIMAIANEKEDEPTPVDMHEVFGWPWRVDNLNHRNGKWLFARGDVAFDCIVEGAESKSKATAVMSELMSELFDGEGNIRGSQLARENLRACVAKYGRRLHEIAKGESDG